MQKRQKERGKKGEHTRDRYSALRGGQPARRLTDNTSASTQTNRRDWCQPACVLVDKSILKLNHIWGSMNRHSLYLWLPFRKCERTVSGKHSRMGTAQYRPIFHFVRWRKLYRTSLSNIKQQTTLQYPMSVYYTGKCMEMTWFRH
jgi:hypothetical protein